MDDPSNTNVGIEMQQEELELCEKLKVMNSDLIELITIRKNLEKSKNCLNNEQSSEAKNYLNDALSILNDKIIISKLKYQSVYIKYRALNFCNKILKENLSKLGDSYLGKGKLDEETIVLLNHRGCTVQYIDDDNYIIKRVFKNAHERR